MATLICYFCESFKGQTMSVLSQVIIDVQYFIYFIKGDFTCSFYKNGKGGMQAETQDCIL